MKEKEIFFQSDWIELKTRFRLPTKRLKKRERIRFWDSVSSVEIKYGDLEGGGIGACLSRVRRSLKVGKFTEFHAMEVLKDLIRFREEVEDYYNRKNWFLYEWYYPLESKIQKLLKKGNNGKHYRVH